ELLGDGFLTSSSCVDGQNTLFVSADGIYTLRADSGNVLWHQSFNADQSVDFTPVTAVNGAVYVGRTDGGGNSVLYRHNASTGAELLAHGPDSPGHAPDAAGRCLTIFANSPQKVLNQESFC
ncbi:MAG TPA: hypothetical protein VKB35_14765, partial [Ktedonobacteraceae bacterium]|nr:hypothetical protein [Ktedonobacteraceae bacterium]